MKHHNTPLFKRKKNSNILVLPGERELDVWHACVCVQGLFNSKNHLSPTPFKNQYFFNKYEHILYNKMHNAHVQNATINPNRKKKSVFKFSTQQFNVKQCHFFSPFLPNHSTYQVYSCICVFSKINKLTRRSRGVKEKEIIFHFPTNKKIKQKQIRRLVKWEAFEKPNVTSFWFTLVWQGRQTPPPLQIVWLFFSLGGGVEKRAVTFPSSVIVKSTA